MKTLLMGGQACVFYGAAEFSRDLDLLLAAEPTQIDSLHAGLIALGAISIAVPEFDPAFLEAGHALHFRCSREDVKGLRIDVMTHLRGVAAFGDLWERRTVIEAEGEPVDMLGLPDLVLAKKTQRDKDWPMIRRLLEQSYFQGRDSPSFWLRELRTPQLLIEASASWSAEAASVAKTRPAVAAALDRQLVRTADLLAEEEREERERDRIYWAPLKKQLEQLRFDKRQG